MPQTTRRKRTMSSAAIVDAVALMAAESGRSRRSRGCPRPKSGLHHPLATHVGHEFQPGLRPLDGAVRVAGSSGRGGNRRHRRGHRARRAGQDQGPASRKCCGPDHGVERLPGPVVPPGNALGRGQSLASSVAGLGPKSAGIILSFSLGMPAMAIDTTSTGCPSGWGQSPRR